ncbi:MAG: pantoate--beta-alanine ligase [Desulfosarcinaceae bacterium]
MQIIHDKEELRRVIKGLKSKGKTIGLVPTMGYLHEGHLSLIRRSRQENDCTVVSVFVNPAQFSPSEDLEAYPRDTERDIALLQAEQTDIAFFPSAEALYPRDYVTWVQVEGLRTQTLCARSRPTHFRGVATIVAKLFHMAAPTRAYFGQKDAQQVVVIEKMVEDLDFDLEIVACPIVREADGLAMSSRNAHLTPEQRTAAAILSKALFEARDLVAQGERDTGKVSRHIAERIASAPEAQIDYISIVDGRTLEDLEKISGKVLIALAVYFGRTRLIDNVQVEV